MATTLPVPVPVIMLQMQAIAGHDTSARLPDLDVPTLVIHGTEDRMLPVANAELIARHVPGRAARAPRGRRAPVLVGAARALGASWCASTRCGARVR